MSSVFVYSIFKGKISRVSYIGWVSLILVIIILVFWQITFNDRIANLLLQGIYLISYVPTGVGIIKGTVKEHYPAWIGVFVAYMFSVISVWAEQTTDWIAYAHPVVNGLICNGIIIALIFYKKSRQKHILSKK